MKLINMQFAPNTQGGGAAQQQAPPADQNNQQQQQPLGDAPIDIDALLNANIARSQASKSKTIDVMVTGISGWKSALGRNGEVLETVMVQTDKGNFWPLKSAVKNMPKSFFQPIKAKAVVTPRMDRNNNMVLNLSQLEFEGLDTTTALAINEMKPGTALFASLQK